MAEKQIILNETPIVKKPRVEWIDSAKAIGILCVIFAHGVMKGDVVAYLYSFHLPLFFILNGLTLRIDSEESFGAFLERKMKSYLIPIAFLGILSVLADLALHEALGIKPSFDFFINGLIQLYQQVRSYPLWFVGTLFVSDILCYWLVRLGHGHLWLSSIWASMMLTIAIFYNFYYHTWIMWNLDVALFGSVFVFCGHVFAAPFNKKPREFLLAKRWRSLIASLVLLGIGMPLVYLTIKKFNGAHLEMWAGLYRPYYLILPIALINSFGVIFFSRAITNKPLAFIGQSTIVLLAFHQRVGFPIFNHYVAKAWVASVLAAPLADNDIRYTYYALAVTSFTLLILLPVYCLTVYTPLAPLLNRPWLPCYQRLFASWKAKMTKKKIDKEVKEEQEKTAEV